MTLSIIKLEQVLKINGFLIKKKFTIHGYLKYIEVINIITTDSFMLYIPSKYKIGNENKHNSYKIKYLDINDEEAFKNIKDNTDIDLESQYNDLNIFLSANNEENIERYLNDNYDNDLLFKKLHKNDKEQIKEIFYQLSRFKLCVKNIDYKLTIIYKHYLCVIKYDNSIECYNIKNYEVQKEQNIFVTIDIETLLKNINHISKDINIVKNGIYEILDDNQLKHTQILNNIIKQNSLLSYSQEIFSKKDKLRKQLLTLQTLLIKINNHEKIIVEKIVILNKNAKKEMTLNGDIQIKQDIYNYEKQLEKISSLKQELMKNIIYIRDKQENITLEIDKVLFDNTIMFNIITKNFNKLLNLVK